MDNINPNRDANHGVQSFNANTEAARLGFALRDKNVTEATAMPHVVSKLGMSYQTYLSREATPMIGLNDNDVRHTPLWRSTSRSLSTIPGAMVFEFEHLMAVRDQIADSETNDIFVNKWEQMRILNNMTKNWQPQDLQYLWLALMEIKAHVANIRRILNIVAKVVNHELNNYYSGERLVEMLGFPMDERNMRQKWTQWWTYFNVSILGRLNNIKWLTGMVPGEDRWAGMYSEIYKDVSPYTDYTQLYMLKPKYVNYMHADYSSSTGYVWQFTHIPFGVDPLDPEGGGIPAFETYMQTIHDMIDDTFYDDSAADIIATINAITERNMGTQVKAEYLNFPLLPYEGEEVKLTYDLNMLIAIHNMTIMNGAVVNPPEQDPAKGSVSQEVFLQDETAMIANFAKVVNLPNFGATTADIIDATQWTVVSPCQRIDPTDPEGMLRLRTDAAGTEICTRALIYRYVFDQYDNSYTLKAYNFKQLRAYSNGPDAWTIDELFVEWDAIWAASNFAYAPLQYVVDTRQSGDTSITASHPQINHVIGQTEVIYSAGFRTISDTHRQFIRNFWGYPTSITENNGFQTSWARSSSQRTGRNAERTSSETAADSSGLNG